MIPMNYTIFGKEATITGTQTINALVGSVLSGTDKYQAGVKAGNGKIYFTPSSARQVLEFDPATGTTTLIGTDYGVDQGKWSAGILASNGKIYFIPLQMGRVMVLDPATGTTTLIGTDYGTATGGLDSLYFGKWHGGALASNGKIYCIPRAATQMLEIDPATNTTTLVGSVLPLNGEKYSYGCFTGGKIYGMPNKATNVLVYDVATGVNSYISTTLSGSVTYKLSGCGVHPNNKIYASSNAQSNILVIDTVTQTSSLIGSVSGSGSCFLGKNGLMYMTPFGNSKLIEIDPVLNTATQIGTALSGASHFGSVPSEEGKFYTILSNDTRIEEVELLVDDIIGLDMQIPSDLSTLPTSNYNRYYNNK